MSSQRIIINIGKIASGSMLLAMTIAGNNCLAASEEIQVYTDEIEKPGNFSIDFHNNYVISGSDTPDYPGGRASRHAYHLTPEFNYGVNNKIELGLYLLSTFGNSGGSNYDGAKVRVKYIPTHDENSGGYWGANLEIGNTRILASENPWNAELKGIYGYKAGNWHLAVNTNFDWTISGHNKNPVSLQLASRVTYKTTEDTETGLELYNDLGKVSHMGNLGNQEQMLYGVVDKEFHGFDLELGVGKGLTSQSDTWILKGIVGVKF